MHVLIHRIPEVSREGCRDLFLSYSKAANSEIGFSLYSENIAIPGTSD